MAQTMLTQTKKSTAMRKLHSVHSLLVGRVGGKIELTGRFSVKSAGQTRKADNVKATLLATQGSIQSPPPTPSGASASMLGAVQPSDKPATDATGSRASVGVMYFKLSALKGTELGVPMDLSSLQLNVRLNPLDETARALQFWFSVAVQAVMGESPDSDLASQSLSQINKLLKA